MMPIASSAEPLKNSASLFSATGEWKKIGGLVFVLCVLTVGLYGPSAHYPFQYDDLHSIVENPHIRTVENIPAFFFRPDFFSADPRGAMYRPLLLVSYSLNYAIGEYQVPLYHWFNMGLHLGNALLLFALLRLLFPMGLLAYLASVLFLVHPINSEVVVYISSRSESLCAFFSLAASCAYIRSGQKEGKAPLWFAMGLLCFALALLSKSVAVVLPLILFFAADKRTRQTPIWSANTYRLIPYFALAGAYVLAVRNAIGTALIEAPVRDLATHWATQSKALIFYAKLLVMPNFLSVEHAFHIAENWSDFAVLASVGLIACAVYTIYKMASTHFRFWAAWSVLWLLPTLVLPLNVLVNEHRLYLPSMAFAVVVAWVLLELAGRARLGFVALLLILAALCMGRVGDWRSPESLWAAALEKGAYMPRPHLYMGNVHKKAGRNDEALKWYDRALKVYPEILSGGDLVSIYNNTGATYLAMGRNREAIEAYRLALEVDPQYEKSRVSLDALIALQEAESNPEAERLYRSGLVALVKGQLDRAVANFRRSLALEASPATYIGLAQAHERRGDLQQVKEVYQALLALAPDATTGELARRRLREIAAEKSGGGAP